MADDATRPDPCPQALVDEAQRLHEQVAQLAHRADAAIRATPDEGSPAWSRSIDLFRELNRMQGHLEDVTGSMGAECALHEPSR
jgi:hypothetical protein